ncbi:hypothetical protein [Paraburkholderia strydomiana]
MLMALLQALRPSSQYQAMVIIKALFAWLVEAGYLADVDCRNVFDRCASIAYRLGHFRFLMVEK